ncbi:MAG: hypothetical protein O8C67_05065 [Candidatus Methanoperedens sp.]|nr:hypothetical protein [Candidatus Methanoperedens sp.]
MNIQLVKKEDCAGRKHNEGKKDCVKRRFNDTEKSYKANRVGTYEPTSREKAQYETEEETTQ